MNRRIHIHTFYYLFSCILALSFVPIFAQKKISRTVTIKQTPVDFTNEPAMSVWIHGTQFLSNADEKGLTPLYQLTPLDPLYTVAQRTTQEPALHVMYSFLWSGKLSFKDRLRAAAVLYSQLEKAIAHYYETFKVYPKLRLITHSHGGNVALNLARIHAIHKGTLTKIDELILLACPVQRETSSYLADPLFETIYALYSKIDFIQVLDPQGFYDGNILRIFSKRRFDWHQKLLQAEIRINNKRLMHNAFQKESFFNILPSIIQALKEWGTTTNENTADTQLKLCIITKQKC